MALDPVFQLVALLRLQGKTGDAERLLQQATAYSETMRRHGARAAPIRLHAARAYALGGRHDAALEQLGLAVRAMDVPFPAGPVENDLAFVDLRRDPDFKAQMTLLREKQAQSVARLPETFRRHGLEWTAP